MRWPQRLVLGMLSLVALASCTMSGVRLDSKEKSLYERLGGKAAIIAVVDDFTARVATDRRVSRFFAQIDITAFRARLVDQLCEASGGPCKYTGKDMRTAHQELGIAHADFDAVVEDLVITLDKFKVPEREKNELLAVLMPMRKDVVTR